MRSVSELRKDIVSGDWVVIATGRKRRPHDFAVNKKHTSTKAQRVLCPFEKLHGEASYVILKNGETHQPSAKNTLLLEKEWAVQVIPNKYPAFGHGRCAVVFNQGPYQLQDGAGFHDVVVTREHDRPLALMSVPNIFSVLYAYRHRYQQLKDDDCVKYVSIFHNHGAEAGASITHPHSQIVAIPVVPPEVERSIKGSDRYFAKEKKCVHCVMIAFELKEKKRLVYENDDFVVFAPFASRTAFEVRIFPKKHSPMFEAIHNDQIKSFADTIKEALSKLYTGLGNPSYNFFIHTSPAFYVKTFEHYHWHLEIIPKTAIWAGFELGTDINISTITPEAAAAFLRTL